MTLVAAPLSVATRGGCWPAAAARNEDGGRSPAPHRRSSERRARPRADDAASNHAARPRRRAARRPPRAKAAAPQVRARRAPRPRRHSPKGGTGATTRGESAEGLSAAEAVVQCEGFTVERRLRLPPGPDPARARRDANGRSRRQRPAGVLLRRRPLHRHRRQAAERARSSVVSQGDTEVTLAYAVREDPERRRWPGDRALPAEQRQTGPAREIPSASSRAVGPYTHHREGPIVVWSNHHTSRGKGVS